MISKTLKISLFIFVLLSFSFTNAQERRGNKKGNPEEAFKKLDADANGSISLEEFKSPRMKEAPMEPMFEERFKALDADTNGELSLEEFSNNKEFTKEERLQKNFANMDMDANGTIDFNEYKTFVEQTKKRRGKRKPRHNKED